MLRGRNVVEKHKITITDSIINFLKNSDRGATLQEIYEAVKKDRGKETLETSVRSALYKTLLEANVVYRESRGLYRLSTQKHQ